MHAHEEKEIIDISVYGKVILLATMTDGGGGCDGERTTCNEPVSISVCNCFISLTCIANCPKKDVKPIQHCLNNIDNHENPC